MSAAYTGSERRLQNDRRAVQAASKRADDAKWVARAEGDRRAAEVPVECTCAVKNMPFGRCCKATGSAA